MQIRELRIKNLFLGRKAMTNLDSILKRRDITLPTKVHLVKAMVFPVIMYGCESRTIKKAECRRRFWIVALQKTFESPLDSKEIQGVNCKGNQFWIFIDWCCSWNSNILATWCWERLKARGEGDNRGWDGWMASPTWWAWVWVNSMSWWWTGKPGMLPSMGSQRVRHNWATKLNWNSELWENPR